MRLDELRLSIKERHQKGESYQTIANSLGVTKPMAYQIERGYSPGERVAKVLHLDPSAELTYTRKRRSLLDDIARGWGFKSWCAYETFILKTKKDTL